MDIEAIEYGDRIEDLDFLYERFRGRQLGETLAILCQFLATYSLSMDDETFERFITAVQLTMMNSRGRLQVHSAMIGEPKK
jgi:hypothetical protein